MFNDSFSDSEKLYRAINQNWWSERWDRPTSMAFKSRIVNGNLEGISVDRQGDRKILDDVIYNFRLSLKNPFKAIVSVTVDQCKSVQTHPKYCPTDNNKYHSEIHEDNKKGIRKKRIARDLSKMVKIERMFQI